MTDQLSLRLRADLPNHPVGLRPMLPTASAEPFDSPDHLFEPAWGGRRVLALVGPAAVAGTGAVTFTGEDGLPIGDTPPELAGLATHLDARSAILDGELVVVDANGRPDTDELERRLAGETGRSAAYLAFDLLYLDGRSLLGQPLARRREALRRILGPGDEVVAVPAILGEGRALHAAVTAQGLAGVMARRRTGPYLPGIRSGLWRFVPAGAATHATPAGPSDPVATMPDAVATTHVERAASAPVLALISRLPLDLGE